MVEYLVKLELNADSLKAAVDKAVKRLEEIRKVENPEAVIFSHSMSEKFFMRLLYNLFDSWEQFELQARDLKFPCNSFTYQAAYCEICESDRLELTRTQLAQLYSSCLQMIRDVLTRYVRCHLFSLDRKHFAVIFCLSPADDGRKLISDALGDASSIVHTYFNVILRIGAGSADTLRHQRIVPGSPLHASFNLSLFKRDIIRSFEEFHTDVLFKTLTDIIDLFSAHPNRYLQAIDGACNIMYLAISLLPEGEKTYLRSLKAGTVPTAPSTAAAAWNKSQYGWKNCGIGFSEYITQTKIARSKTMLLEENLKIYEVADRLGFETSCYFSKVFKKVEGVSPREFLQKKTLAPEHEQR